MMGEYTLPEDAVLHSVDVHLDNRGIPDVVHLVQYDDTTPVIEANLFSKSKPYIVPETASIRIRMAKPDANRIYDDAAGVNHERTAVYIPISFQMTTAAGTGEAIIEITNEDRVVSTARMMLIIDENPIPRSDIVSSDEWKTMEQVVIEAREQANSAAESASSAEASAKVADEKLKETTKQAEAAAQSASEASGYASAAKSSEDAASEHASAAKSSEDAAAQSASDASTSEQNAAASQEAAANSEQEAENWSNMSKSWAIGEGASETRPDEGTNNSKYFAEQAADRVRVLDENAEAIQGINDNIGSIVSVHESIDAVQNVSENISSVQNVDTNMTAVNNVDENMSVVLDAADNALKAQGAAEDAATSAEMAKEAADRAQSIGQGALGYYATPENLRRDHEVGENGQWAIIGSTDTIWVWDEDTSDWSDSGNKTDLSQYYTKEQTDIEINELQETIAASGKAAEADKLTVPRSLKVNLASTEDIVFDGSADQNDIPVNGVLPTSHGGIGTSYSVEGSSMAIVRDSAYWYINVIFGSNQYVNFAGNRLTNRAVIDVNGFLQNLYSDQFKPTKDDVGLSAVDNIKQLPISGGTMTGDIDMAGHKLTGLAAPTEGTDAATKQYVDSRVTFRFDPDSGVLTITTAAEVEV